MNNSARALLVGGLFLAGCQTARDVAVTTFRVVDTPARYVRKKLDASETRTTTTTTTTTSDVTTPGQPLPPGPPPPSTERRSTSSPQTGSSSSGQTNRRLPPEAKPKTPPSQPDQHPYAKPVPGKPGFVYNPFNPDGPYIDVSGFSPGSKAKDPDTKKIFIVP